MKTNKEKIIKELGLHPFGSKGWMTNKDLTCPKCGRSDSKFGINLQNKIGSVHCFFCDYSTNLFKYLSEIGRKDLISEEETFSFKESLPKITDENDIEEIELKEVKLPRGYERINYDPYLRSRGFKSWQYEEFELGKTDHFLEKKLHKYLIFVIRQKGKIVAWLARSKFDYEWHKENLRLFKEGKEQLRLRYMNTPGVDFVKILGGFDQITPKTKTVILVEGLMDSANVSALLKLNKKEEMKCCFTFGNKVSDEQIDLLKETNVKDVILMYDEGTIQQSQKYSMTLSKHFNVSVVEITDPDIDPGNISLKDLQEKLLKAKNFLYFYTSKIGIKLN
jgi:5S rRNA maturation endonuclease (ribonuclease M5)